MNQLKLVSQPLDDSTCDESPPFHVVSNLTPRPPCDSSQEAACRRPGLVAGVHQHETSGPVSGLHHTRAETALAEKGRLLISGYPRDGYGRVQERRFGDAHGMTGRYNLGKKRGRDV